MRKHLDQYLYYWIVAVISLVALFFLPFVGSAAGLELALPNTTAGWIVYVGTKLIVAAINVLMYHCFFQQSRVNVKEDKRYQEALTILDQLKVKEQVFRSPEEFVRSSYLKKGTTVFITTLLGAFSLGQALLVFDLIMFLTYLFTIIMGLIFGVLSMKSAEIYWTDELWHYAKKKQKEALAAKNVESGDSTKTITKEE